MPLNNKRCMTLYHAPLDFVGIERDLLAGAVVSTAGKVRDAVLACFFHLCPFFDHYFALSRRRAFVHLTFHHHLSVFHHHISVFHHHVALLHNRVALFHLTAFLHRAALLL